MVATDPKVLIKSIDEATHVGQVLDVVKFKEEYNQAIKLIYPDLCKLPGANEATAKLNQLKLEFEKGKKYTDESGDFYVNGYWAKYNGDKKLIAKSKDNHDKLIAVRQKGFDHEHFAKYMPPIYDLASDGSLTIKFDPGIRAVPMSHLKLDQMKVNWILSRLLEFTGLLNQIGYSHVGFTPESVFVVSGDHRIYVTSFYHVTPVGQKVSTIAGNYKHWYPTTLFDKKIAETFVDIELSKRLSVYLLGDVSGNGLKLRKDGHKGFVNFVLRHDTNILKCFTDYRTFLTDNFPMKYVPLNI